MLVSPLSSGLGSFFDLIPHSLPRLTPFYSLHWSDIGLTDSTIGTLIAPCEPLHLAPTITGYQSGVSLNHGPRRVGPVALGRMAPRRKRLRDSVRDGARPTKAQRKAAAAVRQSGRSPVAISSGSEEETPPVSSGSGARPLTAYGMSTGPAPPVVAAAIAEALDHDKLKGDLPPDQFMALARRLQRPYAVFQANLTASDHGRVETVSDEEPLNIPIGAGPDQLGDASAAVVALDFVGPVGSFWPRTPQGEWNSHDATGSSTDRPGRELLRPTPKVRGRLQRPQESPEVAVETPAFSGVVTLDAEERSELVQPGAVIQAYSLLPDRLGELLGPAYLSYCQERKDFEVRWGANEALAVLGRPLHSDRTTRLFLSDVDLGYFGCPDDTRAPATPPTILESMRHRARLQDQAGAALRRAAASGELGAGTPPLAFTPDGDVSDFMARYLYKGAPGNSVLSIPSGSPGTPPLVWTPLARKHPVLLPVVGAPSALPSCYEPVCPRPPPRTSPNDVDQPRKSPPSGIVQPLPQQPHPVCLPQRALADHCMYRRSRPTQPCGCPTGYHCCRRWCALWHVPTLMRNRGYQHHPWAYHGRKQHRRRRVLPGRPLWYGDSRARVHSSSLQSCHRALHPRALWSAMPSGLWIRTVSSVFTCAWSGPCSLDHVLGLTLSEMYRLSASMIAHVMPAIRASHNNGKHTPSHEAPHFFPNGPPGPKSGECSSLQPSYPRAIIRMGLLLLQVQRSTGALDVRVVTPAWGVTEADPTIRTHAARTAAKLSLGTQATSASHFQGSSRVQKRSYIRALRRAHLHGGAWYKGRWISPETHTPHRDSRQLASRRNLPAPPRQTRSSQRISRHYDLITWNVGGLGGGLYDELLLYVKRSKHDMLLIQETKWRFESSWEDDTHHFIHSGTSAKDPQSGWHPHYHL